MKTLVILVLCLASLLTADPISPVSQNDPQRIIGGSTTSVFNYPFVAALLHNQIIYTVYTQWCTGTLISNRAILTAAHCVTTAWGATYTPDTWKVRAGSTFSDSGGIVRDVSIIVRHNNFSPVTMDSDVAVLYLEERFILTTSVRTATIAGLGYSLPDDTPVWVIGWGVTENSNGERVPELRHVQVNTINWDTCASRYGVDSITTNMLCTGNLNVGGVGQCLGDHGGPVIHRVGSNDVIVGVTSWSYGCADFFWPMVNARVSSLSVWIYATVNNLNLSN